MKSFQRFFSKLEKKNIITFIVVLAFIGVVIKVPGIIIAEVILAAFGVTDPQLTSEAQIPKLTMLEFIIAVILVPPIETFTGQSAPIWIVSKLKGSNKAKIIISALVFSLMHLPVFGFLLGAFFLGLILSWAYVVKRRLGRWYAFLTVSAIHALHNLIAFAITFAVGG